LTSISYRNCTVGDVMGMPNGSYGFNILNERAQPVLSIGWTDEEVRRAVGLFPVTR
jgi:hypothetical protein